MKNVIRIVLFCALALGVTACTQDRDPQPDPADGIEELLLLADSGGWIEAELDFEVVEVSASSHPAGEEDLEYLLAALEVDTPEGRKLRAVGVFWSADGVGLKQEDLTGGGRIKIDGVGRVRDGLKAITAAGSATGSLGTPVRASMILIRGDGFFDEADAVFLGDSFTTPARTQRLAAAGGLPLLADGPEGLFVGMVAAGGRDLAFGEMDDLWFSYSADSWPSPYGLVQVLRGYVSDSDAGDFDTDAEALPAVSLALGVSPLQSQTVAVYCDDCDGDVMLLVNAAGFTATDDLWFTIKGLPTIPFWVRGDDEVPLEKGFTCEEALTVAAIAVRGANEYRLHRSVMENGASMARVAGSVRLLEPGSRAHDSRLGALLEYEQAAWDVVEFALGQAEEIGCHK